MPTPDTAWKNNKEEALTAALAATVHYYLAEEIKPTNRKSRNVLVDLFFVPTSTFQKIVSGRRYKGGGQRVDPTHGWKIARLERRKEWKKWASWK